MKIGGNPPIWVSHQKICPRTKIKKSVGAYTTLNIRIYIYIGVQIMKYKILQIENLTTFFTSRPKYTQYQGNAFAGFCNITIVAQIFGNF